MGKKLRNREIEMDTDQDYSNIQPTELPTHKISTKQLRKIIKNENLKKKQLQESKLKKFNMRLVNEQFNELINESYFQCSICLQIMVSPTMMLCGHMYCLKCLQSTNVYNNKCCLCRKQQKNQPFILNPIAQSIIHQCLVPKSDNFINYLCRSTDSEEWNKKRRINNLKCNLVIDFQDNLSTWRKGVVLSIFELQDKTMAKIKTKINGYEFYEVVQTNSRRIAPFTFFTRKRYLQEFLPTLPESNREDRQLLQLQYKESLFQEDGFWFKQYNGEVSEMVIKEQQSEDQLMRLFDFEMQVAQNILF